MTRCRHPDTSREFINSCVGRCTRCGLLWAMIAGRRSIRRRWVPPDDPRIADSTWLTENMIAAWREEYRAEKEGA